MDIFLGLPILRRKIKFLLIPKKLSTTILQATRQKKRQRTEKYAKNVIDGNGRYIDKQARHMERAQLHNHHLLPVVFDEDTRDSSRSLALNHVTAKSPSR